MCSSTNGVLAWESRKSSLQSCTLAQKCHCTNFQGACSDPRLTLLPDVESHLEGCITEINEQSSWKLENVVITFYITMRYHNTCRLFSLNACRQDTNLQNWHLDNVGRKSDHICQFNENSFSKDFVIISLMLP